VDCEDIGTILCALCSVLCALCSVLCALCAVRCGCAVDPVPVPAFECVISVHDILYHFLWIITMASTSAVVRNCRPHILPIQPLGSSMHNTPIIHKYIARRHGIRHRPREGLKLTRWTRISARSAECLARFV
jgi:hypothetical protein